VAAVVGVGVGVVAGAVAAVDFPEYERAAT